MARSSAVLCVLFTLAGTGLSQAAEPTWQEQQNLAGWARTVLSEKTSATTYALSTRINPFFLHGDFNGDGKLDMAVLITEKKSGQQGIAFVHSNSSLPLVVGTGTTLGNGSDDFNWLDAWSLCGKQPIQQGASDEKPPLLRGDALLVQKLEAASALIYWDGKRIVGISKGIEDLQPTAIFIGRPLALMVDRNHILHRVLHSRRRHGGDQVQYGSSHRAFV